MKSSLLVLHRNNFKRDKISFIVDYVNLDYISIIDKPIKNRAKCYYELIGFIFNRLEYYYYRNLNLK
jgi:hypothetical protein